MNHARNVGKTVFYVSDCRVWAEINYLDSPTDYREYLPTASPRRKSGTNNEWLDPDEVCVPPQGVSYFVLFLVCMLVLGLLLYMFGHY